MNRLERSIARLERLNQKWIDVTYRRGGYVHSCDKGLAVGVTLEEAKNWLLCGCDRETAEFRHKEDEGQK